MSLRGPRPFLKLSSRRAHLLVTAGALALAVQPGRSPGQATPAGSPEPLPYDLAFDMRAFLWSTALAVAPDGNRVAYAVRQPPVDANVDVRFMPNGAPASVVGSRIYITDTRDGGTLEVWPGGNCWRPSWSPDGQLLAFYSDRDGPPQLWVYDARTRQSRKISEHRIKAKLWAGEHARWAPDGQTLYVPLAPDSGFGAWLPEVEEHEGAAPPDAALRVDVLRSGSEQPAQEEPGTTPLTAHYLRENNAALAAVRRSTGEVRLLVPAETQPRPSVLRVSPSGRWISYLSVFKEHGITNQVSTFDLAVVPSAGGAVNVIAEDLPVLRDYHRLNYSWHPERDQLVYVKDAQIWLVDVGTGGPRGHPRRIGAELGDLAPTVHWFTRDGNALVVGTDPIDDRDYNDVRPHAFAVVPLDGGPAIRVSLDEQWVYQDIVKADARTVWQPDGESITLILTDRSSGEKLIVRFNYRSGEHRVLWRGLARFEYLTTGGGHGPIMGVFQDVATPPDVYRFSPDFSTMARVSHIEPRLDHVAVGTAEIFETTVPLYDGTLANVRSAVLLPPGARRGDRLPALIGIYPGGDRSRNAEVFGGGMALTVPNLLFTSRGYAVLLVNLKLGPNGEAGNPIQEMLDVVLPQVYRAAELGYIDVRRLAVGGQSFGGYGTASIVSGTNLFRAAIAVSGIYDLAGTYGHMDENGGSFWIGWSEGGQARMGTHPWANLRRYLENSPYYRADRIFTPLLIIHGTDDNAYHDAQKLFSALRRLDRPAELASYPGQDHVVYEWTRSSAIDAAQRMVDFLNRHLSPDSDAAAPSPVSELRQTPTPTPLPTGPVHPFSPTPAHPTAPPCHTPSA